METTNCKELVGHTPGPWTHVPGQDTIWAADGNIMVARTDYTRGAMRVNEDKANARLIAAAPALLAALDGLEASAVNLHCALQSTAHMDPADARIAVITGQVVRDLVAMRDRARAAIAVAR